MGLMQVSLEIRRSIYDAMLWEPHLMSFSRGRQSVFESILLSCHQLREEIFVWFNIKLIDPALLGSRPYLALKDKLGIWNPYTTSILVELSTGELHLHPPILERPDIAHLNYYNRHMPNKWFKRERSRPPWTRNFFGSLTLETNNESGTDEVKELLDQVKLYGNSERNHFIIFTSTGKLKIFAKGLSGWSIKRKRLFSISESDARERYNVDWWYE